MKLKFNFKTIEFIPESNEDWFDLGRITKNLSVIPTRDTQRSTEAITKIEVPLVAALNMLSEGVILKKEEIQGE